MDKNVEYGGIKGSIINYIEYETRQVKPAVFSLPSIECKVIEVEPIIKLSDDTYYIECEITNKSKPNINIMKGKWIELYEYWFEPKEVDKFVLVIDYYVMMKPTDRDEKDAAVIDCMDDTIIKKYIEMYNQLQDKKKIAPFINDLPSFESIREKTESNRPVCQVIGDFTIPEEVKEAEGEIKDLRITTSMDQDIRRGLEYLVSEFDPFANHINIPVTQYDYPSLPIVREDISEEQVVEQTRIPPVAHSPQLKLVSADIGIGTQNKTITERLIQERETRKHTEVKQKSDILDILDEENRISEQDNFERYISWRQLHKQLDNFNRYLDFQQNKVRTEEILTCTIEQKTKRRKE